jgi:hypothetical protein
MVRAHWILNLSVPGVLKLAGRSWMPQRITSDQMKLIIIEN